MRKHLNGNGDGNPLRIFHLPGSKPHTQRTKGDRNRDTQSQVFRRQDQEHSASRDPQETDKTDGGPAGDSGGGISATSGSVSYPRRITDYYRPRRDLGEKQPTVLDSLGNLRHLLRDYATQMHQKLGALLGGGDILALFPEDQLKLKLAEGTENVASGLRDCAKKLDSCQLEKEDGFAAQLRLIAWAQDQIVQSAKVLDLRLELTEAEVIHVVEDLMTRSKQDIDAVLETLVALETRLDNLERFLAGSKTSFD